MTIEQKAKKFEKFSAFLYITCELIDEAEEIATEIIEVSLMTKYSQMFDLTVKNRQNKRAAKKMFEEDMKKFRNNFSNFKKRAMALRGSVNTLNHPDFDDNINKLYDLGDELFEM